MSLTVLGMIVAVASPFVASIAILTLGEARDTARFVTGVIASIVTAAAALAVGAGVAAGDGGASAGIPLLGLRFALTADRMGVLFAVVASVLWAITTVYATGYMSHGKDRARFFAFFAMCVGSAVGIAFSANLLTLFVFYEILTLATYPLVAHNGGEPAIRGGRTYLTYALSGGVLLVVGIVWLYAMGGGADFTAGGTLPAELLSSNPAALIAVFALLMAGFGVKAALFPLHGWLPAAMVAPAPVSSLLHAVAVVKAGVFAISRVTLDVYGPEATHELGVALPLAAVAGFTILFGSVRAIMQDDIKRRLAYSTISQLSYIVLGVAIGSPLAAAAALAHLAHHAALKITMFFTAGAIAEELKIYRVSQMNGLGKRMPITMTAFTVAALGIIGVPPIAGFASKWGLGLGALEAGEAWPLAVLSISSVLSAVYFFPMIGRAWFGSPDPQWGDRSGAEGDRRMVWPLATTAAIGAVLGVVAGAWWAPVSWAAVATGARGALAVPWRPESFAMDAPGFAFLVLSLAIWVAVAAASWRRIDGRRGRFALFATLAAAGSLVLSFSGDAAFFYAGFSMMALSAYGLIAHGGDEASLSAGRTYLAFTVVAEAAILAALIIGSTGVAPVATVLAGSELRSAAIALLLVGFGIKIGMIGLHGWMPSAYMSAPGPVRAAVAGVTSSAGILGLVRFMPGGTDLPGWGETVMALGLASAFFGAVVGSLQRDRRVVLAYSSISQFGLMTTGLGAGLMTGSGWPAITAAMTAYMVHHGLAKAALFAADDSRRVAGKNFPATAVMVVSALSLAGLPLTSGAIAKIALKSSAGYAKGLIGGNLSLLLSAAAVGTTVLMARFLYLSFASRDGESESGGSGRPVAGAFAAVGLVVLGTALPWFISDGPVAYATGHVLDTSYLVSLGWPLMLGSVVAAGAWALRHTGAARVMTLVGPGDIWRPLLARMDAAWKRYLTGIETASKPAPAEKPPVAQYLGAPRRIEAELLTWPIAAGTVGGFVLLFLLLSALL